MKDRSHFSLRKPSGGFCHLTLCIGLIDRGDRSVWEISLAYILIERANSSALLPRPSSLTAFRFVQIDHRVMTISIATSSLSANMIETASIADICSAKLQRAPSKANKFHTCLARLHLKKTYGLHPHCLLHKPGTLCRFPCHVVLGYSAMDDSHASFSRGNT